jgi:SAM-dependent methyltransferase
MHKAGFIPKHEENRMKHEGDVAAARKVFLNKPSKNLLFLLEKRHRWMNKYIKENDKGIEFGSGTGISKYYIRSKNFLISDITGSEWLDYKFVDAMSAPFGNASFDFIIAENLLHHLAFPLKFIRESYRMLKPGGVLIIQETNASFFMKLILRLMKHEGYSMNADVFDESAPCKEIGDPWSANNAVSNLLFDDLKKFRATIPFFKIEHFSYSEFFILLNSGGVIAKTSYVPLPWFLLRGINFIDNVLIHIFPKVFALQKHIVLKKMETSEDR